ncbi:MAG: tetratricopeptide repeat protein [Verrucomicrobia bacterium]|nr:tetratricopeptide repeat protein [Verrucomicrobiota bacterium]MBT7064980.1 tetratricopeptide repeat protein [Verrucomicrobiota bacterium]MBT7700710.1 tetratricopeptide repeat protein [Verrucomicrobiota bacterium]
MNERDIRWRLWVPLAIVVATVLAYVNAFGNPFLFDDEPIIMANPHTQSLFPLVLAGRWLVNLTFKLNFAVGQFRVADYHATNLMIHLAAALLLFGWVRRTLLLPRVGEVWRRHATGLAGAIAGLWAVHPLQTQSVTYICQRYESLMGLCFIATLYAFVRGVQTRGRKAAAGWFGVAVLICMLGMGTKEVMATAPLVVLLYDALLGACSAREALTKRWLVHVALWATLVCLWVMERQTFGLVAQEGGGVTVAVSPVSYLLTQMQVIPHYLRLSLVPHPLCLDYGWPIVSAWQEVVGPGSLLVGLGVLTLVLWIYGRPAAFVGLWFFCILAPTSSVIPIPDAAFEHRMYLPLAAVIASLVLGGFWLLRRLYARTRWVRLAMVAVVLLLGAGGATMTHHRNLDYRSGLGMWQNVVAVRPQNYRAHLNLTSALLTAGRAEEAEATAKVLLDRLDYCRLVDPGDVPEWGRTPAEVVLHREVRYYTIAHNYMGVCRIRQGDPERAEHHFAEAVRLNPGFEHAKKNLARVRSAKEKPRRGGASLSD